MQLELVIDSKSTLGESPSWDGQEELLYWVDILQKKIHRYDPAKNRNVSFKLNLIPGSIAPRENGEVVVALETGFFVYNWLSENLDELALPEGENTTMRFNDGKCDSMGRFWAGSMDKEEEKNNGTLYTLHEDLSVTEKLRDLGISNGLAWSPDQTYMFFIDTPTQNVVRYDYEKETGEIANPEAVISFKNESGYPDGMTIDEEGMLWIAHWGGHGVSRWNPETGDKLDFVELPAVNVTSCVFGGKDLSELYITTARKDMTEEQLAKYPHSGGVFRLRTNIKGMPTYPFKG